MKRRQFLERASAVTLAAILADSVRSASREGVAKILLRSSWQTVNIGDIAHTPGMLALLEQHLPTAEVTLWPSSIDRGVDRILAKRFPKLKFATTASQRQSALEECDFFLHGSGPGLVGKKETRLALEAGKPYGFAGVTLNDDEIAKERDLLQAAKFVFLRDTDSMKALLAAGISGPQVAFGPDATFAIDLRDDLAAERLMAAFELEPGRFMCAIPRLRYTPYWEIHTERPRDAEKVSINEQFAEADAAKLRQAITAWVRETGMKAFLVPEMTYQLPLLKTLLYDKLPEDVQPRVAVLDRYWITDEAVSLYAQAAALVSCEQHSPIMCISQGVPAILLRQPTDTRKGQMWRDVGLERWIFEMDEASGDEIAARVVEVGQNLPAAKEYAAAAHALANARMATMVRAIG